MSNLETDPGNGVTYNTFRATITEALEQQDFLDLQERDAAEKESEECEICTSKLTRACTSTEPTTYWYTEWKCSIDGLVEGTHARCPDCRLILEALDCYWHHYPDTKITGIRPWLESIIVDNGQIEVSVFVRVYR